MPDSVLSWNRKDGRVTGCALRGCCTLGPGEACVYWYFCVWACQGRSARPGSGNICLSSSMADRKGMKRVKGRKTENRLAFFSAFPSTQTLADHSALRQSYSESTGWIQPSCVGFDLHSMFFFDLELATNIEIGGDFTENFRGREMRPESAEPRFPNSPKAEKSNSTPLGWSGHDAFSLVTVAATPCRPPGAQLMGSSSWPSFIYVLSAWATCFKEGWSFWFDEFAVPLFLAAVILLCQRWKFTGQ